jgi:hypothetical protein
VLRDPDLRARLGRGAAAASVRFDAAAATRRIEKIYSDVAASRRAEAAR